MPITGWFSPMISPGDTHKKCRSRQSNQIRDLFYLSSSFSSVHLCCSKSLTVLCVCAPKLLLPVSIIQFSSAARINQSSLRCLLFANNFSWLLSNSSELSYWRWNFYCILSFLFIFAYNFAFSVREYGCCCRCWCCYCRYSREYTNYVNFCFFIQDYSN